MAIPITTRLGSWGVVGALLGAAAVGAAAGVAGERYALRRLKRAGGDPHADEPFGRLPADEVHQVETDDGVPLHVEVLRPRRSKSRPAVVFVPGFCLDMGTWHFQRSALSADNRHTLVFYDQPGHGRSGRRAAVDYTLEQLAADLRQVIRTVVPDQLVVLVGHSMGGMAVMAYAERYPEEFGNQVVGAVFLSTSAGGLDDVALGLPRFVARLRKPLMPSIAGALKSYPRLGEWGRASGSDLAYLVTRHFAFGGAPSESLTEHVASMNAATSVEVIAGYLATLSAHNRQEVLPQFAGIPTLVMGGERDLLTPVEHSQTIAAAITGAELEVIPGAGHLAVLEQHELVSRRLAEFLRRVERR